MNVKKATGEDQETTAKARSTTSAMFLDKRHNERDEDPHWLARVYLRERARDPRNIPEIHYWRGDFWRYDEGRFVKVAEKDLRAEITHLIKDTFVKARAVDNQAKLRKVTQGVVGNTIQALSSYTRISDAIDQPCWLGDPEAKREYLAVSNGLLDVAGEQPVLHEHTPEWFTLSALPVLYDPAARCPRWLAFLEEVLEGDQERIAVLQEWFGYCVTSDTRLQKFVLLEGEGANGKSVVLEQLTRLLGQENVSAVPLEQFGERFQLTSTVGKLANICFDVGDIDKVAEGHLKQFTGGDRMYFDRKNQEPIHAYPSARTILAANNRPRFSDRSGGLWRRMIVMPFRVVIPPNRQDKNLPRKLQMELPGVLNWALEGRSRLLAAEAFTRSAVCEEAQADYRSESNPAKVFLTHQCDLASDVTIVCQDLYEHYRGWCQDNGFKPLDATQFGKEVKRAFPKLAKRRESSGKRRWFYIGLRYTSGAMSAEDWSELETSLKNGARVA